MKLAVISRHGNVGLAAIDADGNARALFEGDAGYCGDVDEIIARGASAVEAAKSALVDAPLVPSGDFTYLPVVQNPGKIICVGLNYSDHAAEGGMEVPEFPTIFARFASGLVGHGADLLIPPESDKFDYEGELAVVIGTGGRRISKERALDHVAGYSIFNDASVRDFQLRTPQWTLGKNFDHTGAFGPCLVTPDDLPAGATGLKIETRLNGEVVQSSNTGKLIFDVATLIHDLSIAMTLSAGDVIITGTPAGVGAVRTPPLWMKPGDLCEVEIEGLGVLANPVRAE
ncbi:fumarylacetoacetate hydrolase family protein [Thalassovita taeanensis]|uniref:2-keto-4-pentenoate hydratase/2-oxohepta-3-ene-1,7-dioic acid hydratase (Catechol pathway) n=1 Tax=Thalassovita taeanensis TaxID=657014 RepID=A0A1H9HCC0_9RHOB|nr:fumarylacetoacetate hydrolase family protein [Thalassovita taeanensis]SEQ60001.1 2-keto-4-pentenoate hydratase/2-oxohepta-3-ene-1,7-dioic acid hydratase (catechol pathway) [Thalassovita taeanensis]